MIVNNKQGASVNVEEAGPAAEQRIGIVVPFDMALDREMWRWTPADVSLLFTRTPYEPLPVTVAMAEAVGDIAVVERGVRDLATVGPAAYAYGCTSGSFVHGLAGEHRLREAMSSAGGAPAVTTSGALLQALAELGIDKVAIATPYDTAVTDRLSAFLEEDGHAVVGVGHLGLQAGIWTVSYAETARLIRCTDTREADAVLVSCTNLPTYDLIAPLEKELGKPVITANQATMWAALRMLGRTLEGRDQLLASR